LVIKSSSASEVRSLVAALSSSDGLRREAAIARLAVIGSRATERLTAALPGSDGRTRVGILRALEAIADPRALPAICDALQQPEGGDCAVAAAGALKPLLDASDAGCAAAALDALVEAALDQSRERRVRLAAYAALQEIPAAMLAQVQSAFAATAGNLSGDQAVDDALLGDALDGHLPDDPAPLRDAIAAQGPNAPLTALQKLIDAIRTRERAAGAGASRAAWQQARGAAHHALALRGSRVALYDLRETVETAEAPLPPSFISALRVLGDASCVEPLAAALARAPEADLWWRHQLASALRAIAKRERITRRHAAMKRALARWPVVAQALD
jgi:hypothetical protein